MTVIVQLGELGIRSAVSVPPSTFLASTHFTNDLLDATFQPHCSRPVPRLNEAQSLCICRQHWKKSIGDCVSTSFTEQHSLDEAENDEKCSRFPAVFTRESGAWLRA